MAASSRVEDRPNLETYTNLISVLTKVTVVLETFHT